MPYVDEEQMDVMAFEMGQTRLRGSRFADKVEDVGRNIVGGLQAASQDQEGIGDDILRAGGKVLQGVGAVANLPGIKQGLQVLDAPFHYGSKLAGAAAERMGIDPRLGEWTVRGAELATGLGAAKKAPQLAKKGVKAADNLAYQASARILNEMAPAYLKEGAGSLPVTSNLMKSTNKYVQFDVPVDKIWQGKANRVGGGGKFSTAESASQFVDKAGAERFNKLKISQLEGKGGKQSPFAHHHMVDHQLGGQLFNRKDASIIDKELKKYGVRLGDDEYNIIALMDEKVGSQRLDFRKGISEQASDLDQRSVIDMGKSGIPDPKNPDEILPPYIRGRKTFGEGPEQFPGQLWQSRYKSAGIDRKKIKVDPKKHILGRDHIDIVHRTQELPAFGKKPNPRIELEALIQSGEYWRVPPKQAAKLIAEVATNQRNIALNTAQWRLNLIKQKMGLGKITNGKFVPSKFKQAEMRRSPEAIRQWVLEHPSEAAVLNWGKAPPQLDYLLSNHGRVSREVKEVFKVIDDTPTPKHLEAMKIRLEGGRN